MTSGDEAAVPVSIDNAFAPGVRVHVEYTDALGATRFFRATVHSLQGGFLLTAPDGDKAIRLKIGQELAVIRFSGLDAYILRTKVQAYRRDVEPAVLVTTPVSEVEQEPRRRYFRVDVAISFKTAFTQGLIVNASGSGFLLCTEKESFKEGQEFYVSFRLPGRTSDTEARVQVARAYVDCGQYYAGVHIISIRPRMQDELIRYLLSRQRELPKEKTAAPRSGSR